MARPRKEIDEEQFEKLCAMHCTLVEIAGWFDCSMDTIERWCKRTYKENFADTYKKKSSQGNISLRRIQFKQAEKNPTMAIWLGKQWLGQTDKIESTSSVNLEVSETAQEIERIFNIEMTEYND